MYSKNSKSKVTKLVIIGTILVSLIIFHIQNNQLIKDVTIDEIYKINDPLFIEGLERIGKNLFASIGKYGNSKIGIIDLKTGQFEKLLDINNKYFGEGLTYDGKSIWYLTYKENTVLIINPSTLEITNILYFKGEGWGICFDGTNFITSDGSEYLTFRNKETFQPMKKILVHTDNEKFNQINELEYYNGHIYANVWHKNIILKIDSKTGNINTIYDCNNLIKKTHIKLDDENILNGIAHLKDNYFIITGKNWSYAFKVSLN